MKALEPVYEPATIHAEAVKQLPAKDIDHYNSDLYIRVTPESMKFMRHFKYHHLVTTFTDCIDHSRWYDLPFCYIPGFGKWGK